jgi:hypothetical protein
MNPAVDTTLTPVSRRRSNSSIDATIGSKLTKSGNSARSTSTSSVAVMPSVPTPHSSPTSRPTLSGPYANTPTSSRSGWRSTARAARRPTLPVVHCTTRRLIGFLLDVAGA